MYGARHWEGIRLLLFWLAVLAAVGVLWWTLSAGVYHGTVESITASTVRGLWTPAFASGMTLLVASVAALALAWVTQVWLAGRAERSALRSAEKAGHRQPLM